MLNKWLEILPQRNPKEANVVSELEFITEHTYGNSFVVIVNVFIAEQVCGELCFK